MAIDHYYLIGDSSVKHWMELGSIVAAISVSVPARSCVLFQAARKISTRASLFFQLPAV
jgi:hypothetical protein